MLQQQLILNLETNQAKKTPEDININMVKVEKPFTKSSVDES